MLPAQGAHENSVERCLPLRCRRPVCQVGEFDQDMQCADELETTRHDIIQEACHA